MELLVQRLVDGSQAAVAVAKTVPEFTARPVVQEEVAMQVPLL
jgi:hypothetical protein